MSEIISLTKDTLVALGKSNEVLPVAPTPVSKGLQDLAASLRELVRFRRDGDAILCLLWAAQCWLGPDVLPEKCLVYLDFVGSKSSGKTTATDLMTELVDGVFLAGGTTASLRDILAAKPKALGIDEVDIRMKQLSDLEGILRIGNKWHAFYSMRIPKENGGWDTTKQEVGGPKVMNYRYEPEDAMASRSIGVELEPHNDARMIIDGLFGNPKVAEIRDALSQLVSEAIQNWDAEKLEAHMKSDEFLERVRGLGASLPRGTQVGAVLLAIADVLDWKAEDAVRGYLSEARDDAFQAEREIVLEIYEENAHEARDGILELPNGDVHESLNNGLRKLGLRPLGRATWKRIRRELRIKDRRENSGLVLIFDASTREAIGA
jgi:hypothetical protein